MLSISDPQFIIQYKDVLDQMTLEGRLIKVTDTDTNVVIYQSPSENESSVMLTLMSRIDSDLLTLNKYKNSSVLVSEK